MSCGSSDKKYTDAPQWFDPLGARKDGSTGGPTGAPEIRDQIFKQASSLMPSLQSAGASAYQAGVNASRNPAWGNLGRLASDTISGKYLQGSPQLDAMGAGIRRAAGAAAADAEAGVRDQFSRTGMRFGTGYQQASQANKAAAMARAAEAEAGLRLADYQQERQNQQLAGTMLEQASSAPMDYLNKAVTSALGGEAAVGSLLQALAGQGQIATPNSAIVQQPGVMDYLIAGTQAAGSLT